jgi:uncharacterized protein
MNVVFDTNIIISRYLSPTGVPAQLLRLWKKSVFTLVTSEPILQEYKAAMLYPRIQVLHHKSIEVVDHIVENFRKESIYVTPAEQVTVITKDPDDNKFLSCALAGNAEHIISGDHHLLDIREYRGIRIVSPTLFLRLLERENST